MFLWQKRTSDSLSETVQDPALGTAYTSMLMAGRGCVRAGVIVMLPKGHWSPATTGCVTAPARSRART